MIPVGLLNGAADRFKTDIAEAVDELILEPETAPGTSAFAESVSAALAANDWFIAVDQLFETEAERLRGVVDAIADAVKEISRNAGRLRVVKAILEAANGWLVLPGVIDTEREIKGVDADLDFVALKNLFAGCDVDGFDDPRNNADHCDEIAERLVKALPRLQHTPSVEALQKAILDALRGIPLQGLDPWSAAASLARGTALLKDGERPDEPALAAAIHYLLKASPGFGDEDLAEIMAERLLSEGWRMPPGLDAVQRQKLEQVIEPALVKSGALSFGKSRDAARALIENLPLLRCSVEVSASGLWSLVTNLMEQILSEKRVPINDAVRYLARELTENGWGIDER